MESLKEFSIPIRGLGNRLHEFEFRVDHDFFSHFEDSMIETGEFTVVLEMDKRPDLMDLNFRISGLFDTQCDRCLQPIRLPIEGEHGVIVKSDSMKSDDDAEIFYIPDAATALDVSRFVYEYVCLSIPLIKMYDCQSEEKPPCDFKVLEYLNRDSDMGQEEENKKESGGSVWDALKDFEE